MSIQIAYRGMPDYIAVPLALLASAVAAAALAALGVFTLVVLLQRFEGPDGPAAGVLLVVAMLNIAVPTFVSCFSALVHSHHVTVWQAPTFAFVLCVTLTFMWMPFAITFAPIVLGTGAVAWLGSCWFLRRRKLNAHSEHVIEA